MARLTRAEEEVRDREYGLREMHHLYPEGFGEQPRPEHSTATFRAGSYDRERDLQTAQFFRDSEREAESRYSTEWRTEL